MPDVWATVAELDPGAQASLADVLETPGADPQQQALRTEFLGGIAFPPGARVLEVGCGTGVLTRRLARLPEVASVVGVDVAETLLERARELAADLPTVSFETGDARSLPFADGSFDAVVLDSTLCHVPGVEAAVVETFRVLGPGGVLAAFDGDYSTVTVALDAHDRSRRASRRWWTGRSPTAASCAGCPRSPAPRGSPTSCSAATRTSTPTAARTSSRSSTAAPTCSRPPASSAGRRRPR
jgi:SAM-dependent methyltransferase